MEPSDVDSSGGTSYWTVQRLLEWERAKEVMFVKPHSRSLQVRILRNGIAGRIHDVALIMRSTTYLKSTVIHCNLCTRVSI
jgi:hypothetical protein